MKHDPLQRWHDEDCGCRECTPRVPADRRDLTVNQISWLVLAGAGTGLAIAQLHGWATGGAGVAGMFL